MWSCALPPLPIAQRATVPAAVGVSAAERVKITRNSPASGAFWVKSASYGFITIHTRHSVRATPRPSKSRGAWSSEHARSKASTSLGVGEGVGLGLGLGVGLG